MHMSLHRCTPSSSLVDSLSKASYLARPYVLGHGAGVMWKEHHIILGLQTPAGAIQSKFYLQERCRAPELASHHRAFVAVKGDFLAQLLKPESRLPGITKFALLVCSLSTAAKCGYPQGEEASWHVPRAGFAAEEVIWAELWQGLDITVWGFPCHLQGK